MDESRWARVVYRAAVVAALAMLSLCQTPGAQAKTDDRVDALFDGIPHASFEWIGDETVSDRIAINVPVRIDGVDGVLQFDTGLDVTLLECNLHTEKGWESAAGLYRCPRLEVGDMDLGPRWLLSTGGNSEAGSRLGSLGLDVLVGSLVVLDYPGQRLAIMSPGEAPKWLLEATSWTHAELRGAKLFLDVQLGGVRVDGLFFDTGASALDIALNRDDWTKLTGCSGPEDAATVWSGNRWGSTATIVGAPVSGSLVVGSVHIDGPSAYYIEEEPMLFAGWPPPTRGLIGNAPFWDHVVVLDLGVRQRFGVVGEG